MSLPKVSLLGFGPCGHGVFPCLHTLTHSPGAWVGVKRARLELRAGGVTSQQRVSSAALCRAPALSLLPSCCCQAGGSSWKGWLGVAPGCVCVWLHQTGGRGVIRTRCDAGYTSVSLGVCLVCVVACAASGQTPFAGELGGGRGWSAPAAAGCLCCCVWAQGTQQVPHLHRRKTPLLGVCVGVVTPRHTHGRGPAGIKQPRSTLRSVAPWC